MSEVFPDQASLDPYSVWDLFKDKASEVSDRSRLVLAGHSVFRGHHQAAHHYLMKLGIPHQYSDDSGREHDWESGWVPNAVEMLCSSDAQAASAQSGTE